MLYNWLQAPGVRNYGLKPNSELLSELEEQTAAHGIFLYSTTIVVNLFAESLIDLNEYLSEITKNWCAAKLEKLGYGNIKVNASEYFPDGTRAHCWVYLQL
jgi:hypothetical protein